MTDQSKSELYRNYHGKIYTYIHSKVNDSSLAEDLCSDVFLKVYEKIDSFDEKKASFSTWIYTIARNTLTDYYRTRKILAEIPESYEDSSCVEDDICNSEMLETLADALEKLDERSRDIVILHYYAGVTLKEIAKRLGISYAYVKSLHSRALDKLKKFFSEQ